MRAVIAFLLAPLFAKLDEVAARLAQLEKEISAMSKTITEAVASLTAALTDQGTEIAGFETTLDTFVASNTELKQELDAAKAELAAQGVNTDALDALSAKIAGSTADLETRRQALVSAFAAGTPSAPAAPPAPTTP